MTRISDADQKWQGGTSWKPGRRLEASNMEAGRTATVVIVAFVAVLLTLAYFHHPLFTSGEYRPGIERV